MAKSKDRMVLGRFILQIALGVMLAVAGIWALQGGGDAAAAAITRVFNGSLGRTLKVVFGVIELLSGIFLILESFIGDRFGSLDDILQIIVMIVWIVAIVLMDFLGGNFNLGLSWFYQFASHMLVLGALIYLRD